MNFRKQEIEETIEQHILVNDVQGAINSLDYYLEIAHRGGKVILAKKRTTSIDMSTANKYFDDHVKSLSCNDSSETDIRVFDL